MTSKKNGLWSDEKAKELFAFIEEQKRNNVPLIKAFDLLAQKLNRKQNSIRNYYYFHLRHLENNIEEAKRLGVTLSLHTKTEAKKFSETEEKQLIENIAKLRKEGKSVRKACLLLANNEIGEMIRLQNKVRQLSKKNKTPFVSQSTKIIQMPPKKNVVSDSEISSLFVGLVKMVQKNALHIAESKIALEKQKMQEELHAAHKIALDKQIQIENLLKEKNAINAKNNHKNNIKNKREEKLENLMQSLRKTTKTRSQASNK